MAARNREVIPRTHRETNNARKYSHYASYSVELYRINDWQGVVRDDDEDDDDDNGSDDSEWSTTSQEDYCK